LKAAIPPVPEGKDKREEGREGGGAEGKIGVTGIWI